MKITLANLATATKQQVFDQVAAHLLHQNAQSLKNNDPLNCMYRGSDGLKCAAGCLIGDNEYKPEMDEPKDLVSTSWLSLVVRGLVPKTQHDQFISDLQDLHDHHSPTQFKKELRRTAEENGLLTDVLEKVTLANLEYKTAQEVFDQAAVHLLTQKTKCVGERDRCLYRNDMGMKCAAGALIADHEYIKDMDESGSSGWSSLIQRGLVPDAHNQLIRSLQSAHDNNFESVDTLRYHLSKVAANHGLNTTAMMEVIA